MVKVICRPFCQWNWHCACAVSGDLLLGGLWKPHIWNRRPHFAYSLYNFYGATSTYNYIWHPESLYGVSWLQQTSKVNAGNPGSLFQWSMPTWQPGFTVPRQQWSLLNRFRTGQRHCGACRKTWCLTDTDLCPWWDPNDVPHCWILPSYQAEWWSVSTSCSRCNI